MLYTSAVGVAWGEKGIRQGIEILRGEGVRGVHLPTLPNSSNQNHNPTNHNRPPACTNGLSYSQTNSSLKKVKSCQTDSQRNTPPGSGNRFSFLRGDAWVGGGTPTDRPQRLFITPPSVKVIKPPPSVLKNVRLD